MENGNKIIVLRIAISGAMGLVALVGAGVLSWHSVTVPNAWWLVTLVTVGGVTGVEIIDAVMNRKKGI